MNYEVTKVLLKNCSIVATMNDNRDELSEVDIFIHNGLITKIGVNIRCCENIKLIDAHNCIITPGLINTHDHLFQSLTKAVPFAQNASLFEWLNTLYPIWGNMSPEQVFISTKLGLAELALSGCSLSADHMYIFKNGSKLDDSIEAAREVGLRFNPTRGAMSIGSSKGGLPPDSLVETEDHILYDMERVVHRFNKPGAGSMVRIGLAPCSPFSVSKRLMKETAKLARKLGVGLHTHLAENEDDLKFSAEKYGCTPGEYIQELDWLGPDVWHAHCVKLTDREIKLFKETSTGVAHCPCSNCRLGSGIASIAKMKNEGINIGLGVDGSASSDSSHLLSEARHAMLLQRLTEDGKKFGARDALELATIGGARVLGRADVGSIEVGKRADIAVWKFNSFPFSGSWDPVASLVFSGPHNVHHLLVDGALVVEDGIIVSFNHTKLLEDSRKMVKTLMSAI